MDILGIKNTTDIIPKFNQIIIEHGYQTHLLNKIKTLLGLQSTLTYSELDKTLDDHKILLTTSI